MIHPARYSHLGEILADAFLQYKTDTALIEVERERENARYSYLETRDATRRVSAWLAAHGHTNGARVALLATNQSAWLVCAAGALHVGCTLVPLDARLDPEDQAALLAHSGADVVVIEDHLHRKLPVEAFAGPRLLLCARRETPGCTRFEDLPEAEATPLAARSREDLAAIVYSSGTGGAPKGCMLTHGNYLAQYQSLMETFEWRRGDRYLSILPSNHAIDFMSGFIATLCTGGTVVHQRALRPEFITSTMRRYRINHMAVVPLILEAFERAIRDKLDEADEPRMKAFGALTAVNRMLTRKGPRHGISRWLLKPVHDGFGGHLRTLFCGGAFTERRLAEFFYDLGLPVAIGYGLTEACTVAAVNTLAPFRGDTVGPAVPGVQIRIHEPGADGVGEVLLRGPTIFKGYLDDPEQTAASFDGDWLVTGDLGWLDGAHHLHLVGRRKNMIVTPGGKNIYPEDIESAFASVPADEIAVFAENYVWPQQGLGSERLIAVVRSTDDDTLAQLVRHNRKLPDFKRVAAVLMWPVEFPRTASLKVKRIELADTLRQATSRADLLQVIA